jgi:hypothetical protein
MESTQDGVPVREPELEPELEVERWSEVVAVEAEEQRSEW